MKTFNRYNFNKKIIQSKEKNMTVINTPLGYGKTTGTKLYLEKEQLAYVWFVLSGKIDEDWLWSKITSAIDERFDLDHTIFKDFMIPKSMQEIEYFSMLVRDEITYPFYIVLDEVEANKIPKLLNFFKLYTFQTIANLHFVILSNEKEENVYSDLIFNKQCLYINTPDLILTKEEIQRICVNEQISLNEKELDYLCRYSDGWITAVQLMLTAYKKNNNLYILNTLDNLIEEAFYKQIEPKVQIGFMKLSILNSFTLEQAYELTQSKETYRELLHIEKDNSFIHALPNNNFEIMPVLKNYLKKKLLSTDIDINQLYHDTAIWYEQHNMPIDALEAYLAYNDFEAIISVLDRYSELSFMDITPSFITQIFKQMPDHYKNAHPITYLRWINDILVDVDSQEGMHLLLDFKDRLDNKELIGDERWLLGEYYFVLAFTQFNDAKKMNDFFYQAYLCFDGQKSKLAYPNMIATFGSNHMLSLYLNKPGGLKQLQANISKYAYYFNIISGDVNAGADYQIKAEAAFTTGHYEDVIALANTAYELAMNKKQLSIVIANLFLRGRYAILFKEDEKLEHYINELKTIYSHTNIPILHAEIDCTLAHFQLLRNEINDIPKWIESGQVYNNALLHEAHSIAYVTYGLYLAKKKRYNELNAISDVIENINNNTYVLNMVYSRLYRTIALYQLSQVNEAIEQFKGLLQFCRKDQIMTPIIELYPILHHLFGMVIPSNEFEEQLFAKVHRFHPSNELSNDKENNRIDLLTKKEKQVLEQLALNKSLKQISSDLNISINTVQSHTKAIYTKCQVNNKIDAIRCYERYKKVKNM